MNYTRRAYMTVILGSFLATTGAMAQTVNVSLNVQINMTASCLINFATALNLGSSVVLAANVDATSAVTVQCTSGTPYNIGLSVGQSAGATVTNRLMTGSTNTIGYFLYSDATGRRSGAIRFVPTRSQEPEQELHRLTRFMVAYSLKLHRLPASIPTF